MTIWVERTLGEICINHDAKRVPVKEKDRKIGPYPYYGASGIVDYVDDFIFDGNYTLVAEDGENLRTRKTPIAFPAREKFWVNNHAHILEGNDLALTDYLHYLIEATDISGYLTGSTIPKLSQRSLHSIRVRVPPVEIQRSLVKILRLLDDKIELNQKINQALEEIAKTIFKSWFVDFDPVRAKAEGRLTNLPPEISDLFSDEFVETEIGEIPRKWKLREIGPHFECLDRKRIPLSGSERSKRQGQFPYYGATGIIDWVDDHIFDGTYLLIGEDGSVQKDDGTAFSQYVSGKIWVNNHAHVLIGKNRISTEFLFLLFQYVNVTPYITGAVQLKISQKNLRSIPIVVPEAEILKYFQSVISPMFEKCILLESENMCLANLRDTLLPKLISGQLRIPDAEKFLEEAGA